jgi:hypothetical protein
MHYPATRNNAASQMSRSEANDGLKLDAICIKFGTTVGNQPNKTQYYFLHLKL